MMRWMLPRRALVCRDAVALMSDYLDRRLPARGAKRLERHLADCRIATSTSTSSASGSRFWGGLCLTT